MKRSFVLVALSLLALGCPGEVPPTPLPVRSPAPAAPTVASTTAQASQPFVRYYALPG